MTFKDFIEGLRKEEAANRRLLDALEANVGSSTLAGERGPETLVNGRWVPIEGPIEVVIQGPFLDGPTVEELRDRQGTPGHPRRKRTRR